MEPLVVACGSLERVTEVPAATCKVVEQLYGKQRKDLFHAVGEELLGCRYGCLFHLQKSVVLFPSPLLRPFCAGQDDTQQ